MTSGKVYIVQVPAIKSGPRGQWVEKFDLSPAAEYGSLVRMLDYGNVPEDPAVTREKLQEALWGFDADNDYLLLLGDPVACAQAVHVLAYIFEVGHFSALKWDRREEKYFPYRIG